MFKKSYVCLARRLAGAALALHSLGAAAQAATDIDQRPNRVQEEEKKGEMEVPPPPFPKPENLLRFPTDMTPGQVLVDTSSLSIGDDDILRYVLVVRGSGGAENVTFEGLRCNSGERRVYAYGRRGGIWSAARAPEWKRITDGQINRYYFEFYRDVFCDGKATEPIKLIISNLKRGGRVHEYGVPSQ